MANIYRCETFSKSNLGMGSSKITHFTFHTRFPSIFNSQNNGIKCIKAVPVRNEIEGQTMQKLSRKMNKYFFHVIRIKYCNSVNI